MASPRRGKRGGEKIERKREAVDFLGKNQGIKTSAKEKGIPALHFRIHVTVET